MPAGPAGDPERRAHDYVRNGTTSLFAAYDLASGPVIAQHYRSASWLNLAERWFAELTNRKLRRSAHRSVVELEADIRKWINEWNKDPRPFIWTKTADEILETLAAYCGLITGSGH